MSQPKVLLVVLNLANNMGFKSLGLKTLLQFCVWMLVWKYSLSLREKKNPTRSMETRQKIV